MQYTYFDTRISMAWDRARSLKYIKWERCMYLSIDALRVILKYLIMYQLILFSSHKCITWGLNKAHNTWVQWIRFLVKGLTYYLKNGSHHLNVWPHEMIGQMPRRWFSKQVTWEARVVTSWEDGWIDIHNSYVYTATLKEKLDPSRKTLETKISAIWLKEETKL